jgi:hypothetical protein
MMLILSWPLFITTGKRKQPYSEARRILFVLLMGVRRSLSTNCHRQHAAFLPRQEPVIRQIFSSNPMLPS